MLDELASAFLTRCALASVRTSASVIVLDRERLADRFKFFAVSPIAFSLGANQQAVRFGFMLWANAVEAPPSAHDLFSHCAPF